MWLGSRDKKWLGTWTNFRSQEASIAGQLARSFKAGGGNAV